MLADQSHGPRLNPIPEEGLLLDRVANEIRFAILSGKFAPGSRLSVPELARELNVSRTPAREALMRLQHEGLVMVVPRKGAVVLQGNSDDLLELFQFREALEGMAARLAARQMSPEQKENLVAIAKLHAESVRAEDLAAHLRYDEEFHAAIAAGSGNSRIFEELGKVRGQLVLLSRAMSTEPGGMDQRVIDAHEAIVDAITTGDTTKADRVARAHVRGVLYLYQSRGLESAGGSSEPRENAAPSA
ncbi:GntR family transcriptional regulator [Microbacterium sp. zg.B48]|uniref:GntR family transcriptional regulator n=1 Tax=Microbacterium sp. zg.B48 TaxID=2969408 RepID=UPI00214B2B6B|nr:GntR family transcriptional regulator [Microbacterium sp. zg.B48]MCR2764325.1 GntR family transcriptional regulator [Microbacterium sp. zg.B48]